MHTCPAQKEVALQLGVTQSLVGQIENDLVNPNLKFLTGFIRIANTDYKYLIEGVKDMLNLSLEYDRLESEGTIEYLRKADPERFKELYEAKHNLKLRIAANASSVSERLNAAPSQFYTINKQTSFLTIDLPEHNSKLDLEIDNQVKPGARLLLLVVSSSSKGNISLALGRGFKALPIETKSSKTKSQTFTFRDGYFYPDGESVFID